MFKTQKSKESEYFYIYYKIDTEITVKMEQKKILNIIKNDSYLKPHEEAINYRINAAKEKEKLLCGKKKLSDFANGHHFFGLSKNADNWIYRDWLPFAKEVYLIGKFSDWKPNPRFRLFPTGNGNYDIILPLETIKHEDLYKLFVVWEGGSGERIPAYARRVVQDEKTRIFSAQVWEPDKKYQFKNEAPPKKKSILIYESHIGMSLSEEKVASFDEFRTQILPRIIKAGYDTLQLMAIQEHPYYGSFGYHVSSFFAVSSRFGTPDELKMLIDEAHGAGLRVIMDIVHSHAVKNEIEGISRYDGSDYQFFHAGTRGQHPAWDSRCFDYGRLEVLHFLLSNCKFWIEEYGFDGFRFDGVTSMLYHHHGLGVDFMGYEQYFDFGIDTDAIVYLYLANKLIHEIKPSAVTVAEEMSGMPGLASSQEDGGFGFDFRLAMGIPDFWIKLLKEEKDENWHVGNIFWRLTDKRADEKTVNYAESHDQALVGDKTIIFRLADKDMYDFMKIDRMNLVTERAVAIHKMIRLVTVSTGQTGYLNFMGNEFGHPEWIDFPREGNGFSHFYARRQWNLADNKELAYFNLNIFDRDMISVINQHQILDSKKPEPIVQQNYDQVLIFKRGGLIFVFNFNPFKSFPDYGFECPKGNYEIILNSDSSKYLGFGRIDENLIYKTDKTDFLKLYLPNRTALVLKMLKHPNNYIKKAIS
jgi:1,4-alpha-glucan branching enzyme